MNPTVILRLLNDLAEQLYAAQQRVAALEDELSAQPKKGAKA